MAGSIFRLLALIAVFTALTLGTWANAGAVTIEEAEAVIVNMFPGAKVLSVSDGPIEGMIELLVKDPKGKQGIIYIDSSLENIFVGNVINVPTRRNITKERYAEINLVDFSSIPLRDSVILGDPKAPLKVVVFDDPD